MTTVFHDHPSSIMTIRKVVQSSNEWIKNLTYQIFVDLMKLPNHTLLQVPLIVEQQHMLLLDRSVILARAFLKEISLLSIPMSTNLFAFFSYREIEVFWNWIYCNSFHVVSGWFIQPHTDSEKQSRHFLLNKHKITPFVFRSALFQLSDARSSCFFLSWGRYVTVFFAMLSKPLGQK